MYGSGIRRWPILCAAGQRTLWSVLRRKVCTNTLTTIKNTRNIVVGDVIKAMQAKHNVAFGNGYGKLKDVTFRIAHMGDITLD